MAESITFIPSFLFLSFKRVSMRHLTVINSQYTNNDTKTEKFLEQFLHSIQHENGRSKRAHFQRKKYNIQSYSF